MELSEGTKMSFRLALEYFESEEFDTARSHMDVLLNDLGKSRIHYPEVLLLASQIYAKLNTSAYCLEDVTRGSLGMAERYALRSLSAMRKEDGVSATKIAALNHLVSVYMVQASSLTEIKCDYDALKTFEKAQNRLEELIQIEPENMDHYFNLLIVISSIGVAGEEDKTIDRMLGQKSISPEDLYELLDYAREKENALMEEKILKKQISIDPGCLGGYVELVELYMLQERGADAEALLESVRQKSPKLYRMVKSQL